MKYDAIIIGAGLGGLSAGAFIAKAGGKVLVLEKMNAPGGRCRTAELMGMRFDIGADCFGSRTIATLRELGKGGTVKPIRISVSASIEGHTLTLPFGPRTIGELHGLGMGFSEAIKFSFRMARVRKGSRVKVTSSREHAGRLTQNPRMRELLCAGSFLSGTDPENLPAYWPGLLAGGTYGYGRPFLPKGGSGRIAEALAEVIRENGGGIVYNAAPRRVVIKDGAAAGVILDGREMESRAVVSGIGILPTVYALAGKEHFPAHYLTTLGYYREGLASASVFAVMKRPASRNNPAMHAQVPKDMARTFRALRDGSFPEDGMFVLSMTGAGDAAGRAALRIRFLVPKGLDDKKAIAAEAEKVVMRADTLVPG